MFSALVGWISYPLLASVSGEAVTLVGLDGHASAPEVGVMARVQKGDQEEIVALADVEVVDADPSSAEWLAVYRYWRNKV
ncbi:MAG: calcium-binding protein [Chloroflexota bacterium]|nr:calcium-binding protein [Chloroflexota bacterium]